MKQQQKREILTKVSQELTRRLKLKDRGERKAELVVDGISALLTLHPIGQREGHQSAGHAKVPNGWYFGVEFVITHPSLRDILAPSQTRLDLFSGHLLSPSDGRAIPVAQEFLTAHTIAKDLCPRVEGLPALLTTTCTPKQMIAAFRNYLAGDPKWRRNMTEEQTARAIIVDRILPPADVEAEIQTVPSTLIGSRITRAYDPWVATIEKQLGACAHARTTYALCAALLLDNQGDAARTLFAERTQLRLAADHPGTVAQLEAALA